MIKLSELKVIENIFFRANLIYNKTSIYPFLVKHFDENKLFDESSLKKISELIKNTKDNLAHNVILNKDLSNIKKSSKKNDTTFNDKFWIEKLPEVHKKVEKHLGLKFKKRQIRFKDSFPKQFKHYEVRGASTITVFENQKNSGLYFLNKRVDNISTGIHIIHEQIHTCLSQNKDKNQMFMEWFEEGLAILYSLIIFYELTEDFDTLNAYKTRSYVFSKVKPEWDFTKRYFEYMKIMSRIFLNGGLELINKLKEDYLDGKRDKINNFLEKIQDNSLEVKYIPRSKLENFIATFSNIIEPEQITPLEYVIVAPLSKPKSIEKISKEINAPLDVTKNALNRLFGKGICVMVKDNKIDVIWRKKDLFDKQLIKPILPLG